MPFSVHPIKEGITASFLAIWKRMKSSIRDVINYGVPGNIVQSVGFRDVFALLAYDNGKFQLQVDFVWIELGDLYRLSGIS